MTFALTPLEKPHLSFFWSAPFADETEFLPLDPLAIDYLGQQVGLWLFPGFTTRTNRAQYYAVVLYGLSLVDEAIQHYKEDDTDEVRVQLFERWERFWAMAVLASHDGRVERGHPDAMRGVLGAKRAWTSGDRPIKLDYPLISRQEELGGLGAYLSSLRHYQLVLPGSYRPALQDEPIVEAFWDESDAKIRHNQYFEYALAALDRSRPTIDRKFRNIGLGKVGLCSRLSTLRERKREKQQARLFERLFATAKGPTPILGQLIENAWAAKVDKPREVIETSLAGRWGAIDDSTQSLLSFANVFGGFTQAALQAFTNLYSEVVDGGWMMDADNAIKAALDPITLKQLRETSAAFLDCALLPRFQSLPVHARGFVRLAVAVRTADAGDAAEALLRYHTDVNTERRQGGGWLRRDDDKLVVNHANWSGQRTQAAFPNFRINTVQSLLLDLGRIPPR